MIGFSIPRDIVYGENSLEKLATLKGSRATIVTGGSSMKKFGFIAKAEELLKKGGMEVQVVDGVEPNPSIETVFEGARKMREFEPEWIIALGGGSALDAAKVMWCFYEHPDLKFEDIITPGTMPELRNKARFVAVPSTSGTASEITAFSVITDTKNHIKYPIVAGTMVPDIAIIDPQLPSCMPPHVTANTGMDVFTHAIEAFVSTASTSFTDPLAIEALRLVIDNIVIAFQEGKDMKAREHMHNASALAGMSFTNASLGAVHALAHKIGGEFGVTHGLANSTLMPYIIDYNRKLMAAKGIKHTKYDEAEEKLGLDDIAETVRQLNIKLGIPASFSECDEVDFNEAKFKQVLDNMSKNAHGDPCIFTNPIELTVEDVKTIYEAAYYGKSLK